VARYARVEAAAVEELTFDADAEKLTFGGMELLEVEVWSEEVPPNVPWTLNPELETLNPHL